MQQVNHILFLIKIYLHFKTVSNEKCGFKKGPIYTDQHEKQMIVQLSQFYTTEEER